MPEMLTMNASAAGGGKERKTNGDEWLCRSVSEIVAAAFGVTADELQAPRRGTAPVAFARQAAMYLAHVVFGLNMKRLGRSFGRDRTTARHACRTIEDMRDDPVIDRTLSVLEAACDHMLADARVAP